MNIEFNTKNKTVTIIEMEAKDLHRILDLITQVCGSLDGWNIVSKVYTPTFPAKTIKDIDWVKPNNPYTYKTPSLDEFRKYQVTCSDTPTDLTTEMNGKY